MIGVVHWLMRRPLLEISLEPDAGAGQAGGCAGWDSCLLRLVRLVVTSSVRIAGVLLVFSYLIVPAAVAALLTASVPARRLAIGWGAGALVSAAGLLGLIRLGPADGRRGGDVVRRADGAGGDRAGRADPRAPRAGARDGRASAAPACCSACRSRSPDSCWRCCPAMDHLWLDGLEDAAPAVRQAFLTPGERAVHRDSREAPRARQRASWPDCARSSRTSQWGARQMPDEQQERLRQFLAGRAEIVAGDRLVLATLRAHARARQRFWLGPPLLLLGAAGAAWLGVQPWTRRGRPDQIGS